MWLLNVNTLELEAFFGEDTPRYAILSHTWVENELAFDDWQRLQHDDLPRINFEEKQGYLKIVKTCLYVRESVEFYVDHVWIDTVCIDKRSSAELSEAINSMFEWYKNARVCLVYMADVHVSRKQLRDYDFPLRSAPDAGINWPGTVLEQFLTSRWFSRGWTLQELLAPKKLIYISNNWVPIGRQEDLILDVSKASRVPLKVLSSEQYLDDVSIAEKMSWASKRETTRPEDTAYCLLGIFNVNMPLLYGEGSRAFRRLQLEIIKESDDHSLFTWDAENRSSIFAPSPKAFEFNGRELATFSDPISERRPYYMTNVGLLMTLPLIQTADNMIAIAILNCVVNRGESKKTRKRFYLILRWLGKNRYHALGATSFKFRSFGEETLSKMNQKIYLETATRRYDRPGRDYAWRPTGRPFFFTFFCGLGNCSVDLMILDRGKWQLSSRKSQEGLNWLHETGHASGMQLAVAQMLIDDNGEKDGIWYTIVHHPLHEIGWFVFGLGYEAPSATSYEAMAEQISTQVNLTMSSGYTFSDISMAENIKRHYYEYKVEKPVWPLIYRSYHNLADCPLVFLSISS